MIGSLNHEYTVNRSNTCVWLKMANKNPKIENLTPFKPKGEKPLSSKPLQIRIDQDLYDTIMSLPKDKRLSLLRQWIENGVEGLERETAWLIIRYKSVSELIEKVGIWTGEDIRMTSSRARHGNAHPHISHVRWTPQPGADTEQVKLGITAGASHRRGVNPTPRKKPQPTGNTKPANPTPEPTNQRTQPANPKRRLPFLSSLSFSLSSLTSEQAPMFIKKHSHPCEAKTDKSSVRAVLKFLTVLCERNKPSD